MLPDIVHNTDLRSRGRGIRHTRISAIGSSGLFQCNANSCSCTRIVAKFSPEPAGFLPECQTGYMYIPTPFVENRMEVLDEFINAHPFAILMSNGPEFPHATHVPMYLV